MKGMGLIEIEGMSFYAYHGHFKSEKVVGNQFIVDLHLTTDCRQAAISDDLKNALNYQEVYNLVKQVMAETVCNLLEKVAENILTILGDHFPQLESVRVKISKLNPNMGGQIEKVSVTLQG